MNDKITNGFSCQICYEIFDIENKFKLYCCKAIMCNDCVASLEYNNCPFCRAKIYINKNIILSNS